MDGVPVFTVIRRCYRPLLSPFRDISMACCNFLIDAHACLYSKTGRTTRSWGLAVLQIDMADDALRRELLTHVKGVNKRGRLTL
jgi:hypothetical protein